MASVFHQPRSLRSSFNVSWIWIHQVQIHCRWQILQVRIRYCISWTITVAVGTAITWIVPPGIITLFVRSTHIRNERRDMVAIHFDLIHPVQYIDHFLTPIIQFCEHLGWYARTERSTKASFLFTGSLFVLIHNTKLRNRTWRRRWLIRSPLSSGGCLIHFFAFENRKPSACPGIRAMTHTSPKQTAIAYNNSWSIRGAYVETHLTQIFPIVHQYKTSFPSRLNFMYSGYIINDLLD